MVTFIGSEIRLFKRISTRIGARAESVPLSNELYISPRFSLAYKTSVNSQISLGYGSFSEQPLNEYLAYNNKLKTEQADHFIINYQLTKESRIFRIEAYYKNYDRLIKYDSLYATAPEAYNNKGSGYAKGIDLFYRDSKSIKNGDFWISYSLIDSKRNYKDYTLENYRQLANCSERILLVYKNEWLPYYYEAYAYINMGFIETNEGDKEMYCDKAQKLLDEVFRVKPDESEIYVLQSKVIGLIILISVQQTVNKNPMNINSIFMV